jgi:hypothetical protein
MPRCLSKISFTYYDQRLIKYPFSAECFRAYRAKLMELPGYLARPYFLSNTTWYFGGRGTFLLTERMSMKPCRLVLVGRISSSRALVHPLSIVESSLNNMHIVDMKMEICVQETDAFAELQTDFHCTWKNLRTLLCNPAIQSDYTSTPNLFRQIELLLQSGSIIFSIPLFRQKVS